MRLGFADAASDALPLTNIPTSDRPSPSAEAAFIRSDDEETVRLSANVDSATSAFERSPASSASGSRTNPARGVPFNEDSENIGCMCTRGASRVWADVMRYMALCWWVTYSVVVVIGLWAILVSVDDSLVYDALTSH